MKVGIIRYPCSNGDNDMLQYFDNAFYIWHKETVLPDLDMIVIPGGFAFGDRYYESATGEYIMDPGRMAIESPVTKIILEAAEKGIPILGICNGFQILIKLGLLPGELVMNDEQMFVHKRRICSVRGHELDLIVANKYGKYLFTDNNVDVFMTYEDGTVAGVKQNNIYGIMPHPERTKNQEFKMLLELDIALSQVMSSEHITYKSTKKYLKNLPCTGERVVVPPGENAGIVDIGNGYGLAIRIESHNHPLMINAYEAAATGVGGIIRDIFAMGARPIALLDFLRFHEKDSERVRETIRGIAEYGNCIGIPNVGGDFILNECYEKNPLLNVACLGLVKLDNIVYGRVRNVGDKIIYIGNKTGTDGVGGTCMASKEFTEDKNNHEVQFGDAFLEKLLLEACCECAEAGLLEGMQDMGAGGLICSAVELIQRGRIDNEQLGCHLYVDNVPVRYDMKLSDILISESQERMLLICKEENYDKIKNILDKWDLECHCIGEVVKDSTFTIYYKKRQAYQRLMSSFTSISVDWELKQNNQKLSDDVVIKDRQLWEQYDSTIGCRTIKGCLDKGNYSLLDVPEVNGQIMITWGSTIKECKERMDDKAEVLCVVNCLNYGNPKDIMQEFVDNIHLMCDESKEYKAPIVGGNVSLYNATDGRNIKGTPVIVMCGLLT